MKKGTSNLKSFCNGCNRVTNHKVVCEHKVDNFDKQKENGITKKQLLFSFLFQIIECVGCGGITFREKGFFPQLLELDSNGRPIISANTSYERYYPERIQNLLVEKRITGIPLYIKRAYKEVIESYNLCNYILCSAGLRAIVESICSYFNIGSRSLKDNIEGLGKTGLISFELAESLKIHKFLGDKALHLLEIPDKDELKTSIHLLELTLETVFDIPKRHQKLKENLTKRVANK